VKPLRTYIPEDAAAERVAVALGAGLDAANCSNRSFAADIGKTEKSVRKMRGGELGVSMTALIQVQSDRAFEEIVEALRAQRAKVHGEGLDVPREAATAGVGGACTTTIQSVLDALRDGRVTDEEVREIQRAVAEITRHARSLRTSMPTGQPA
jgi:hypothetical protein